MQGQYKMQFNPFDYKTNGILPAKQTDHMVIEKKSTYPVSWPWLINGQNGGENNTLTIKRALKYYDEAAPVSTAIDWINDEFKNLSLVLKKGEDVDRMADVLRFMRSPNDDMTQEDFLENTGALYLICNEVYWLATGRQGKEPAEIYIISPEHVTVGKNKDGLIDTMKVKVAGMTEMVFSRSSDEYRFYSNDGDAELWQVKGFSAVSDEVSGVSSVIGTSNLSNARGRSKLSSITREINQYIEIGKHNLATLDNGMKPSGTIEVPDGAVLDDDQFERLKEQIINYYSGASNSAKTLILDNGMKFIPSSLTAKDMDFEKLMKSTTLAVFNRYKVPLPLISPDNMTLANMESARLNLYDNCVIPLARRIFRELTNFLAPRFNLTEDELICSDMDAITALQIRRNQELKLKKELDILTKNELRKDIGKEETVGGDVLYQPINLVPIGTAYNSTQANEPASTEDDTSNEQVKTSRVEFVKLMQAQVDKKGNRVLTDDEIHEIANNEELT